jgi:ubiquinone/menaquinone biosynthesis C-methylase UbiE
MNLWLLIGLAAPVLALLGYWLLHITEGAFLGPHAVTLLYDWSASRYDAIKSFSHTEESWFLARPLLNRLAAVPQPLVLDVATGTGRLPYALLREANFQGRIVGLDLSYRMLEEVIPKIEGYADRVLLLHHDATLLPFPNATFDAVVCLEALEFLPHARRTLQEMVRVLRPGGVLLTTNRRGWEARLFLGRTFNRTRIISLLGQLGLSGVTVQSWQHIYDLVWARKRGGLSMARLGDRDRQCPLAALVRCPQCQSATLRFAATEAAALYCPRCRATYPLEGRIASLRTSR